MRKPDWEKVLELTWVLTYLCFSWDSRLILSFFFLFFFFFFFFLQNNFPLLSNLYTYIHSYFLVHLRAFKTVILKVYISHFNSISSQLKVRYLSPWRLVIWYRTSSHSTSYYKQIQWICYWFQLHKRTVSQLNATWKPLLVHGYYYYYYYYSSSEISKSIHMILFRYWSDLKCLSAEISTHPALFIPPLKKPRRKECIFLLKRWLWNYKEDALRFEKEKYFNSHSDTRSV